VKRLLVKFATWLLEHVCETKPSELNAFVRYAETAEVVARRFPERYDNYGRPQQIPVEVRARLRREWDAIGSLEPVDKAARGEA
jgi:hypothetical protein